MPTTPRVHLRQGQRDGRDLAYCGAGGANYSRKRRTVETTDDPLQVTCRADACLDRAKQLIRRRAEAARQRHIEAVRVHVFDGGWRQELTDGAPILLDLPPDLPGVLRLGPEDDAEGFHPTPIALERAQIPALRRALDVAEAVFEARDFADTYDGGVPEEAAIADLVSDEEKSRYHNAGDFWRRSLGIRQPSPPDDPHLRVEHDHRPVEILRPEGLA